MKISGVYKITNTATGDFYIGSSKDIKRRWKEHKCQSVWKKHPRNQMYLDFQKYGLDYFVFEMLEEVEPDSLKEKEQQFIEKLKPTYNSNNANVWDIKRYKEYKKSDKWKKYQKEYQKKYHKSDKWKEYIKKYNNQSCYYNGDVLTVGALAARFRRAGVEYPNLEAKKYLIKD